MSRLTKEDVVELDMEFFLERESVPFKVTRGVSGVQLNIKTCPHPDCQDSRWRTYFGVDTGRGNCFVCSQSFTKESFIHYQMGHEDKEWGATWREIAGILAEQGWRPKREALAAIDYSQVTLPVSEPLPLPGGNIAYLEQRGFNGDIARYFSLRLCEFGWWKFVEDNQVGTQDFSNRIIIPVFDLDGTIKTFQGRDLTGSGAKKYLFPKGLPGTGRYLLNGQNVMATDSVVLGEGVFDIAAIKVAFNQDQSLRHVIPLGSFGKHLSYGSLEGDDQLGRFNKLKHRGLKFVTIMWDGEQAALIAALSAAKLLTGLGLIVRIALLPFDKDPNEVTAEIVRKAYYEAQVWSPALDIRLRLKNPYKGHR